ncbi:MAG: 50S ribosomal protein L17 [candidate division Zixibacteria bacterium 4484_95]|nr:MAG: 50S ribosomal protein L17 [candidate division Zixibacteria bacterium 4484_95]RKX18481.1 MAG: 50S ribosomal protein L17 [candidate division Zixibacteria bacterium]
MRHRKTVRKLGVKTAHRKAMMANMAASLITYGKIKTTVSRAKALLPVVSRLVTLGKKGDIHSRRLAFATLRDREILKKLFDEIAPEFKDRSGGYARIIRAGYRKGDGASMAVVEFLIEKKIEKKEEKKSKAGKKTEAKATKKSSKKDVKKTEAKKGRKKADK